MNVQGNAMDEIFRLEHPDLLAIWEAEAKMRIGSIRQTQCLPNPLSSLAQQAAAAMGRPLGLFS